MQTKISKEIASNSNLVSEAPQDDKTYLRKNQGWLDLENANVVKKTGDTMSGSLVLNYDQPRLFLKDDFDYKETPSENRYTYLNFWDKNYSNVGLVQRALRASGQHDISLALFLPPDTDGSYKASSVAVTHDGSVFYGTSPNPRENTYSNDIDTLQASINRHPVKYTSGRIQIHVGGANSSDTTNLWQGRGMSTDLPFASLQTAMSWAKNNIICNNVEFILHSDINTPTADIYWDCYTIKNAIIKSDETIRTVNTQRFICYCGILSVQNINVNLDNTDRGFVAQGNSAILSLTGNISVTGSTKFVADANTGGYMKVYATFSGNVTGQRYICTSAGVIDVGGHGANVFPGTSAGTCDENGKYF